MLRAHEYEQKRRREDDKRRVAALLKVKELKKDYEAQIAQLGIDHKVRFLCERDLANFRKWVYADENELALLLVSKDKLDRELAEVVLTYRRDQNEGNR